MPGTQLLLSANTLEDEVVRLFRQWLKEQERINSFITEFGEDTSDDELDARDQYRSQSQSSILWVDQNKNVGLKVRVRQKCQQDDDFPVVIHQDEVLTSYEIDIEGVSSPCGWQFESNGANVDSRTVCSDDAVTTDYGAVVGRAAELQQSGHSY